MAVPGGRFWWWCRVAALVVVPGGGIGVRSVAWLRGMLGPNAHTWAFRILLKPTLGPSGLQVVRNRVWKRGSWRAEIGDSDLRYPRLLASFLGQLGLHFWQFGTLVTSFLSQGQPGEPTRITCWC